MSEGGNINLDNCRLDECLRPHKLIVRSIVVDIKDVCLPCHSLRMIMHDLVCIKGTQLARDEGPKRGFSLRGWNEKR